ncbi:hypothetical protein BH20ACT2_BH20ACT2_18660 [soil metagenome]
MTAPRVLSDSRVIAAPAEEIFAVLADPSHHQDFDGSGSVRDARGPSRKLALGDTFGMDMRIVLPYRITNTVVEYEEGRLIAWRHFHGHRWRYELESVDGATRVTESFDWSRALTGPVLGWTGIAERNLQSITATLERLDTLVAGGR